MAQSKKSKFLSDMVGTSGGSLLAKGAFRSEPSGVIPTGIEEVDRYVLGCGGLPLGRISEVYGPPGAGKSSFVYSCLRQVQLMGGIGVLIHTEEAAQKARLVETFGVDPEELILIEPEHMEGVVAALGQVLAPILASKAKDKPPVLIAWDSLAATRVKDHDNVSGGKGSKESPAERARLLNSALRVIPSMVATTQAHWMIVNQNRTKVGVMFGSDKTQPGGNAPKYASTFRLELSYIGKVGETKHPTGIKVKFFGQKNKMGPPFRVVESELNFRTGWTDAGVKNLAKDLGLLAPRQGVAAAREALNAIKWDPDGPVPTEQVGPAADDVWEGEEGE